MTLAAEQDRWLAERTIACERFELRLTPAACEKLATRWPLRCAGCEGPKRVEVVVKDKELITMVSFVGENAEVVRRLMALSAKDGTAPADDICTILELYLDGRLRLKEGKR